MKCAIYKGIKNIELKEMPEIECGDNNVVIKNIYAGICGSDVTAYNYGGEGVFIFPDHEFGHEMVSKVVKVGKNVKDVTIGTRVFPVPSEIKENMLRASTAGGFSEEVEILNFEMGRSAVIIPESITDKEASIIEPFLIGSNAVRPLNPEKGKKAIVFGAGAIGMTAAMVLKYKGCDVLICDIINSRLDIAKEYGFFTCNTIEENYLEKAKKCLGSTQGFNGEVVDADYYVDAAGNQAVMDMIFSSAKIGAKDSIVAVYHKPVLIDPVVITYSNLQLMGPNGNYHDNLPTVLEILDSHMFDVTKMITHEYSHDNIIEAFEMASKQQEALKVVIKY
jgi:2-desacetyl-2-hydroxyethyl bacteriochlorophyllide A dehydrogenase